MEGLVDAERHALGVGPLQLLIAQVRAQLVEAVLAVAGLKFLERTSRLAAKGLRGAVEGSCPVPLARSAGGMAGWQIALIAAGGALAAATAAVFADRKLAGRRSITATTA